MTSLTADEAVLAILQQAKGLTEIRDPKGAVIGYFAPAALGEGESEAERSARFDPAEIERRKSAQGKGRTTRQVFEYLQSLTTDEKMRGYLQQKIDSLTERDQCGSP